MGHASFLRDYKKVRFTTLSGSLVHINISLLNSLRDYKSFYQREFIGHILHFILHVLGKFPVWDHLSNQVKVMIFV